MGKKATPKRRKEWHESPRFWEVMAPKLFSKNILGATRDDVDHLLTLIKMRPNAAVLDLACGQGRHSLELARRGFRVTGVDDTPSYLREAKQNTQREGLEIEFIQADMRQFYREIAFDVVISLYTSFGYFRHHADEVRTLRNVHRSLKKGGVLVMDLAGREVVVRNFRPTERIEDKDYTFLAERKLFRGGAWLHNRWIIMRGRRQATFDFSHRLYSATDITRLLKRVGFINIHTYGSLRGTPYDDWAQRLVVVARK